MPTVLKRCDFVCDFVFVFVFLVFFYCSISLHHNEAEISI